MGLHFNYRLRFSEHQKNTMASSSTVLDRLFRAPDELLAALAPAGWNESPFFSVFHPTAELQRVEAAAFYRNVARLFDPDAAPPDAPDDDVPEETSPVDPDREVVELLGRAAWDVFSDGHVVTNANGVACELGSFRGSADCIAEAINVRYPSLGGGYQYIDFYMGTSWVSRRADFQPVYCWIFRELQGMGCDWEYSFPRIRLVNLGDVEASADQRALAKELDDVYMRTVEKARNAPRPPIVAAYNAVFGKDPVGWPPV
jgi:hypothetical protein